LINLPFTQENLKSYLIRLMRLIDKIGEKPQLIASTAGIPLDGKLGRVFESMILRTTYLGEKCVGLLAKFYQLKARVKSGNYLSRRDEKLVDFLESTDKCLEKYQGNLLSEISKEEGFDLTEGEVQASREDLKKFIEDENEGTEFERLVSLRNELYLQYLRLSRKLSAPHLRFNSEEDLADVIATDILLNSGVEGISTYLEYLLVGLPIKEQIRCKDYLKNNREPSYGPLNRLHHSECWRTWRAMKIEQEFQEKQKAE